MKIKKIGHCCLVIETGGLRVMTDPGSFSSEQEQEKEIDIVLITHEHGDHLHIDSLKKVLNSNPEAVVYTNSGVAKLLDEANIPYTLLEGRHTLTHGGVSLEAFDGAHEEIFEEIGQVQNTGYMINETLFYPGDSFIQPNKSVDVLALPVAGPWCKIPDAIRYALAVAPRAAFPVHDAVLMSDKIGSAHTAPGLVLGENNITFVPMLAGDEHEF